MVNNDIHYLRKEVDNLQTNMKSFDVTMEYATSNSDSTPPTKGWSTSKPAPVENVFIWARNILNMGYGDIITEPYCIGDGLEHILSIDVEYIANTNPYDTPSQDSTYWQTDAPTPAWNQYIWTRSKIVTTEQTVYTSPVRVTGIGGELLADGRGYPSGNVYIHLIFSDVNNPSSWNQCYLLANKHDYVGVLVNDSSNPVTDISSYSFMSKNTDLRFNSENNKYFFIRYSEFPNGYDEDNQSSMNTVNGAYIGYATQTSAAASTNAGDYTWVKVEGTGIRDIIEYYARSTSYTTPPSRGWSNNPPNYTRGYFYWTKTVIYYIDGSVSETTPLMVSGLDGENIHYVYYCSNSSNVPSTPIWSDIHQNTGTSSDYNRWCEDPVAVTEDYPFIYISSSTDYNPLSSSWSNFTSPSLWSTYAKDGINGADGDGEHYIYFRTTDNTAPQTPNINTTTIIDFTKGDGVSTYTGMEWTEDPLGATHDFPYEWVSVRTYDGNSKSWTGFSTPSLWDSYSYYGDNGDSGVDGTRGADGTNLTSTEVRDKSNATKDTNNPLVDNVEGNFVQDYVKSTHLTKSSAYCINQNYVDANGITVRRQGEMVILSVNNLYITSSCPTGEWVSLFNLPSWAIPIDMEYAPSISANGSRCSVTNASFSSTTHSTPSTFRVLSRGGDTNFSTFMAYVVDKEVGKSQTTITLNGISNNTVQQGSSISATLKKGNDELPDEKIYFKINGVIYPRTTDIEGIATLNINLAAGTYQLVVWYDGNFDSTGITAGYGSSQNITNITIVKSNTPSISFGYDNSKGYYALINTSSGSPFRYVECSMKINGSESWNVETDGEGKIFYNLMGYENKAVVSITVPTSNRCSIAKTESHTHNLLPTGTYTQILAPASVHGQDIAGRVKFQNNSFSIENIKSLNDGKCVKSNLIPYSSSTNVGYVDGLWIRYKYNNIPTNATITGVTVLLGVINLSDEGNPFSCMKKYSPSVHLRDIGANSIIRNEVIADGGRVWVDKKDSGVVKEFKYTITGLSYTNIDTFNNDFGILIMGDRNYGDSGYFAVDYVETIVTYVIP